MLRRRIFSLLVGSVLLGGGLAAEDPRALLEKVRARYAGLSSYQDLGEYRDITGREMPWSWRLQERRTFQSFFRRDTGFLFAHNAEEVWAPDLEQGMAEGRTHSQTFVGWGNPSGFFVYFTGTGTVEKVPLGRDAVASLTGVTHRAVHLVLPLLDPTYGWQGNFADALEFQNLGEAEVDGVPCQGLRLVGFRNFELWIGKSDLLIRKIVQRSRERVDEFSFRQLRIDEEIAPRIFEFQPGDLAVTPGGKPVDRRTLRRLGSFRASQTTGEGQVAIVWSAAEDLALDRPHLETGSSVVPAGKTRSFERPWRSRAKQVRVN